MMIYVFGELGSLLVKVGYSGRAPALAEREMTLRRFWGGGEILYVNCEGTITEERRVHDALRSQFWLDGEWFTCGAVAARSAIRHTLKRMERARRESWRQRRRKRLVRRKRKPEPAQ